MPFSDRPPSFVFPDTDWGREAQRKFVGQDASTVDILIGTTALCGEFDRAVHPVYTDDDLYRNPEVPVCGRRKRDGVRDMNWCCRCISGLPYLWLTERDKGRLTDSTTLRGF